MLLLCGEADFKAGPFPIILQRHCHVLTQLISNAAFIDRKIKFQVSPKCNIALKFLRMHLASILALQFRAKVLKIFILERGED